MGLNRLGMNHTRAADNIFHEKTMGGTPARSEVVDTEPREIFWKYAECLHPGKMGGIGQFFRMERDMMPLINSL